MNKYCIVEAVFSRYVISDGVTETHLTESQLEVNEDEIKSLHVAAREYAKKYDHNGNDDEYAVCEIEDLHDGENHRFAFDGNGNFEWDTDRQG